MSEGDLRAVLAMTNLGPDTVEMIVNPKREHFDALYCGQGEEVNLDQEISTPPSLEIKFTVEWLQHNLNTREFLLSHARSEHRWPVPDRSESLNRQEDPRNDPLPDFMRAVAEGNVSALAGLRANKGFDAGKWRDSKGRSALHITTIHGSEEGVRLLACRRGAVDARDSEGRTPLHYAASLGDVRLVRILISEFGADPCARDTAKKWNSLHMAVDAGQTLTVQILVMEFGCWSILDSRDSHNRTPLLITMFKGLDDTARMLIDLGAHCQLDGTELLTIRMQSMVTRKLRAIRALGDVADVMKLAKANRVDDLIGALSTGSAIAPIQWLHLLSKQSLHDLSAWVDTALSDASSTYTFLYGQRRSAPDSSFQGGVSFLAPTLPVDIQRVILSFLVHGAQSRRQLRMVSRLLRLQPRLQPPSPPTTRPLSPPMPSSFGDGQRRKFGLPLGSTIAKAFCLLCCCYVAFKLMEPLFDFFRALSEYLFESVVDVWNGVEKYQKNGLDQLGRPTMRSRRLEREKMTAPDL